MNMETPSGDIAWVIDRVAIQDAIQSVTMHTDMKEYDAVYQYYTDDAVMDYTTLLGEEGGMQPVRAMREKMKASLLGFDVTHHQSTNFQIRIDGDEATSRAHVRATHRIDRDLWTVGGTYHHRLRRTPSGWKIFYHRFDLAFVDGEDLIERACAIAAEKALV